MWANHTATTKILDKRSIGIEMINPGPVYKNVIGYQHRTGPKEKVNTDIINVGKWRDFQYFIPYTQEQLKSLYDLINHLINQYPNIGRNIPKTILTFDKKHLTFKGVLGHLSLKTYKTDVHLGFPIQELIKNCNLIEV